MEGAKRARDVLKTCQVRIREGREGWEGSAGYKEKTCQMRKREGMESWEESGG
jgi:hypothetical protein